MPHTNPSERVTKPRAEKPKRRGPPLTLIRKKVAAARVGWHPSHLMRKVRAGEFPQPVDLGPNSIAFVESEVDDWIRQRMAKREGGDDK